jgi:DNA polymerase (family 10)
MKSMTRATGQVSNAVIAGLLRRFAAALVVQGADRFKVKAYRRAADTLETLPVSAAERIAGGSDLTDLPGIGKAISGAVQEIVRTGTMPQLDRAVSQLPSALLELTDWPALDPKKVQRVYKKLKIGSVNELRERLESGEVRQVFGPRMDFHVRTSLADRPRLLLWSALKLVPAIEGQLKSLPNVQRVSAAGSLRRRQDTVGDLNFLVGGTKAAEVFRQFSRFGGIESSETRGKHERLFTLSNGIGITLRWSSMREWGLNLLLATGSAAHLDDLQKHARKKGLELTADILKRAKIDLSDEESVYGGLGLPFIEPELREGHGEVRAAQRHALPRLVTADDIRGDLHMHTTESDGSNSLEEMVQAAQARGYAYIAITDHSQSLKLTNGLSEARLRQQIDRIDRLNERLKDFVILKSAEVDILQDGSLDYPNALLKELDLTICSIHSRFALDEQQQTDRVRRAMDNPHFTILGHATGRLLLKREGYGLDMEKVIEHARANGCFFEINSSPDRLDLSDEHARMAKSAGVKIAINTDAHAIRELGFLSAGLNQARRAWLSPHDVLNTRSLRDLRKAIRR